MAFYKDMPGKKAKRTNYGEMGSWEEEGSRYSERRENGGRYGEHRRPDDRAGRPSFNKGNEYRPARKNGTGEHRRENEDGRFRTGGFGQNAPYGARGFHDRDDRRDRPGRTDSAERSFRRDERPGNSASVRSFQRDGMTGGRPAGGSYHRNEPARSDSRQKPFAAPAERDGSLGDYRDFEYRPTVMPREENGADNTEAYILGGRNPIREALKNGRDIEKLLVQRGELSGSAREIVQMAKDARVPVQVVDKARLDEIAEHHQGMLAFASAYQYATVDEMLRNAEERGEAPFLILLDGVTDPHNLGAVIRTAECVGAHGVIVPERRSVGLTPAAVKASAGAVEHMPVARVTNLNRTIDELKKKNIWAYAVTMDGEDYESVDFNGGTALVIGAEGEGISRLTVENCDQKVSLPMKGHIDSLNASVAAGVVMYRVLSARKK